MNLDNFQYEVGEWGKETFPQSTIATITEHLRREAVELQQSIEKWQREQQPVKDDVVWPSTMQEVSGVILLALHLAHRRRFLLSDVLRANFMEAQARTWGEPDEQGVVEHVCDCCLNRPCICPEDTTVAEVYSMHYEGL